MNRKNRIYLVIILVMVFVNQTNAQVLEVEAKKTTESFFAFCKKNDFQNSAKLLAYMGADQARLYSDFYNPNNPDELKEIKRICKKINATLLISDSYSFGDFEDKTINGKKLQYMEVQFLSGSQKIKRKIFFVKIKDSVAIFDYN